MTRVKVDFPRKLVNIILREQKLAKNKKKKELLIKSWINTYLLKKQIKSQIKQLYKLEGHESFLKSKRYLLNAQEVEQELNLCIIKFQDETLKSCICGYHSRKYFIRDSSSAKKVSNSWNIT